jgi:hypothetical protein
MAEFFHQEDPVGTEVDLSNIAIRPLFHWLLVIGIREARAP